MHKKTIIVVGAVFAYGNFVMQGLRKVEIGLLF